MWPKWKDPFYKPGGCIQGGSVYLRTRGGYVCPARKTTHEGDRQSHTAACSHTTRTLGFQPNGFTQDPVRIRGHQAIMWGGETLGWTLGWKMQVATSRATELLIPFI